MRLALTSPPIAALADESPSRLGLHLQDLSEGTAMRLVLTICALFYVGVVAADADRFITKIYTKTLYIYDDNGKEIDQLKADAVKKEFVSVPIPGRKETGLPIEAEDVEEGLLRISLKQYPEGAWIETMAVEIWPENRIKCPDSTTGEPKLKQSVATIGFGEHCENSGQ